MVHPWPTREWDERLLNVWKQVATREHPHWTPTMTALFRSRNQHLSGFPRPDALFLDRFEQLYKLMLEWQHPHPSKKKKPQPDLDLDPDFDLDQALAFDFGSDFSLDQFFANLERLPSPKCIVPGCTRAVLNQRDVCQWHEVYERRNPKKRPAGGFLDATHL